MKCWRPIAALGLLLAACSSEELTQVVVIVEAEAQIDARAEQMTVVVTTDEAGTLIAHDGRDPPIAAKFPYVIALSPRDGNEGGSYRVEVTALAQGRPLAVARLIAEYVPRETRYVKLVLEDSCVNVLSCSMNQSCSQGTCGDAHVDEYGFGSDRDNAPTSADAGASSDAGGRDAASNDAGDADAGTPAVDSGVRDTGVGADAGPGADTGAPDTGAPPGDSGTPIVCAPQGIWTLTLTEQSGDCEFGQVSLAVQFNGQLDDGLTPECVHEITYRSPDGCMLTHETTCLLAEDENSALYSHEIGMISMVGNTISGTVELTQELLSDEEEADSCESTLSVIGVPP